jgi:hypothetical protein
MNTVALEASIACDSFHSKMATSSDFDPAIIANASIMLQTGVASAEAAYKELPMGQPGHRRNCAIMRNSALSCGISVRPLVPVMSQKRDRNHRGDEFVLFVGTPGRCRPREILHLRQHIGWIRCYRRKRMRPGHCHRGPYFYVASGGLDLLLAVELNLSDSTERGD